MRRKTELGFAFDYIVVCTVTGSTHAGMLVGFARDGRERKVIGIDASCTPDSDQGPGARDRPQHRSAWSSSARRSSQTTSS